MSLVWLGSARAQLPRVDEDKEGIVRVIHVLTLLSSSGAYGGPATVAINQVKALRDQGVEAELVAGVMPGDNIQDAIPAEIPVRTFEVRSLLPTLGFAGLTSLGMLRWLRSNVSRQDVVHLHLARDLVTLPAAKVALGRGAKVFVQTHGMIDASTRWLSTPLDALLTESVLSTAQKVFVLTEHEAGSVREVGPRASLALLPNGVPHVKAREVNPQRSDCEVLFMSRLHERKRPGFVLEAARALAHAHPDASFVVAGPDEGQRRTLEMSLRHEPCPQFSLEPAIRPSEARKRLDDCDVLVLPSVDEPFPMVVLEAMAAGKPVVVTERCGLANTVRQYSAGLVVDVAPASFVDAVGRLLADVCLRNAMGENGRQVVREQFSMESIAQQLVSAYQEAVRQSSRL